MSKRLETKETLILKFAGSILQMELKKSISDSKMSFRNLEEFDKIYGRTRKKEKIKFCNVSIDSLFTFFSVISLFRTYKKTYLVGDVIAGFTVAAFNIPQGQINYSIVMPYFWPNRWPSFYFFFLS